LSRPCGPGAHSRASQEFGEAWIILIRDEGGPGSEADEPEYQPDQHFRSAAGRSDGGTLGRIAVGDHIPFVVPV
jgi:hypothetical protein